MFKKATKEKAKLKLAIFGPSGSGKTFSSLAIAQGLGEKIALIDTENNTACKYSDIFDFDVCSTKDHSIDNVIRIINQAKDFDVLIIDSLSHTWYELLNEVNRIANTKFKGNTWAAWSEGTPKQKSFINALLNYPGHIIATMRVKTEWILDGKRPIRAGLDPEAGKGIEYEFDMLMEINQDHTVYISKDRTGKFQDKTMEKPGKKLGQELAKWLNSEKEPEKKETPGVIQPDEITDFKGIKEDNPKENEDNLDENNDHSTEYLQAYSIIKLSKNLDDLKAGWDLIKNNKEFDDFKNSNEFIKLINEKDKRKKELLHVA